MTAAMSSQPAPAAQSPTQVIGLAGSPSMVRVKNTRDEDWSFIYGVPEQRITIPALSEIILAWEIVVFWMGNPAMTNKNARQKDRTKEYDRIRVLFGAYYEDDVWERNRPPLEVFDLEGSRIFMVADDPEGATVTQASQTVALQATYEQQIAAMQRQIDAMQQAIAQQGGNQAPAPPTMEVHDAAVPPAPVPTVPPMTPPVPSPPFVPGSGPQTPTNVVPLQPHPAQPGWNDTTPPPPANLPPFIHGDSGSGIPEDGAPGPKVT